MRKQGMAVVSVVALAVAIAACGSSSKKTSSSASSSPPPASTPSKGVKVVLRKVSFGTVLVGPNSHTVYLFMKDKGTTSQCNGKCATVWTPLTSSGQPQAGPGMKASLLGTSKRSDGQMQVTYGGHPLYFFAQDKRAGDVNGQGFVHFGGTWWVVSALGKKVTVKP